MPSCASINAEKLAPSFNYAYESIKKAVFGYPDLNISRQIVEDIPYASALLKIGKGTQGLVILESIENKNYLEKGESARGIQSEVKKIIEQNIDRIE